MLKSHRDLIRSKHQSRYRVGLRFICVLCRSYCGWLQNPAPAGNYWDSYETLKIMGLSWDTPSTRIYQLVQDFFHPRRGITCIFPKWLVWSPNLGIWGDKCLDRFNEQSSKPATGFPLLIDWVVEKGISPSRIATPLYIYIYIPPGYLT